LNKIGVLILAIMTLLCSACNQTVSEPTKGIKKSTEAQTKVAQSEGGSEVHYPVSLKIYTDEGKEMTQTIEREPKKVVVIGSAMAEFMIEFGQKEKVVGLGYLDQSFSKHADQISQLPLLTKLWPSKESVLALQPDLIYAVSYAFKENRLGDIAFWNERGIPVVTAGNFNMGITVESYFQDIRSFGLVFHTEDKTDEFLKEQTARMDKIKKLAATATEKPKVLLMANAGRENYDYYPPDWCMIDEMIEGAGGEYLQMTKEGYVEMSMEAIIAANPDKIIVTQFQENDSEAVKNKLLTNERLKNVQAIKTGNVMVADYTNAIRGSLQLADLYEEVAAFIHPEWFGGQ